MLIDFSLFQLDYKVDAKKLKQVFKLAGKVISVDLSLDKDGNSRGFAVVEYDHPVEAVQSISMFDRQTLFDRRMTVRLDRIPDKSEGLKLPEGLKAIGIGLGPNGEPLRDVARLIVSLNIPIILNMLTIVFLSLSALFIGTFQICHRAINRKVCRV
jgi:RNA recognition motif-containing protein